MKIRSQIDKLKENNCEVALCAIKSHCGIELNERADLLAKEATTFEEIDYVLDMPLKTAKNSIKNDLFNSWRTELVDLVSLWSSNFSKIKNLPDIVNFYTSQFITAHGNFKEYKYIFKLDENPNCVVCDKIDNPEHVLFECKEIIQERQVYLHANEVRKKEDLIRR